MAVSTKFRAVFVDLTDDMPQSNKTKRAEIIGISTTTYFNAYNYGILPKVGSLINIADYFNVSLYFLLGFSADENFTKSKSGKTFFERLTELREEKGISTVYELAQLTHIHRNNFAQWRKRGYYPVLDDLFLLADFFGVSADYLLGRTDERQAP